MPKWDSHVLLLLIGLGISCGEKAHNCSGQRHCVERKAGRKLLQQNFRIRRWGWLKKLAEGDVEGAAQDAGGGLEDAGKAIGGGLEDAGKAIGGGLEDAGKAIGGGFEDAGKAIGGLAEDGVGALGEVLEVGGKVFSKSVVEFVTETLPTASRAVVVSTRSLGRKMNSVVQGVEGSVRNAVDFSDKVVHKMGDQLKDAAKAVGKVAEQVGALAIGLAKKAGSFIAEFLECIGHDALKLMCKLLLKHCDCDGGSWVKIGTDIGIKCVAPVEFLRTFGLDAARDKAMKMKDGKRQLPGKATDKAKKGVRQAQKSLKSKTTSAPSGSCSGKLDLAIQTELEFVPALVVTVSTRTGVISLDVSATAEASVGAMLEAVGKCNFLASRGFPKIPKTKVVCASYVCTVLAIQGVVELKLTGKVTGFATATATASWSVSAHVDVEPVKGEVDANVKIDELKPALALKIVGSMEFSAQMSVGPHLLVFPMPGVPVDLRPMVTLELKGHGEHSFELSSSSLVQYSDEVTDNSSLGWGSRRRRDPRRRDPRRRDPRRRDPRRRAPVPRRRDPRRRAPTGGCAAVALNIFAATAISGLGLPETFQVVVDSKVIEDAICEQATNAATVSVRMAKEYSEKLSKCMPGSVASFGNSIVSGVTSVMEEAYASVCDMVDAIVPDVNINFGIDNILFFGQTHFCLTVLETPGADKCGSVTCKAGSIDGGNNNKDPPSWIKPIIPAGPTWIHAKVAGASWGTWGKEERCTGGVQWFRIQVERACGGGDDTAMNSIELWCDGRSISSSKGYWGTWSGWHYSGSGFIGYRIKNEPSQGGGDDTAANSISMKTTDKKTIEPPNAGSWGKWSPWVLCPAKQQICGIQTRVEPSQGGGDDATLGDVKMLCCPKV